MGKWELLEFGHRPHLLVVCHINIRSISNVISIGDINRVIRYEHEDI